MNTTVRSVLIVAAIVVIGAALFLGGVAYARMGWGTLGYGPGGMMGNISPDAFNQSGGAQAPYGYGMMGNGMMSGGMMNNGMMGGGMTGGSGAPSLYGIKPLSIETAKTAVESYLSGLGNVDLVLDEVMIFDNQAYARVVEKNSGVGAFEVLVDPVTLAVSPEPGPNMMWNLKYGMMSGSGMMGMMGNGMMGRQGYGSQPGSPEVQEVTADMPVSSEQALETAQRYLDTYLPGVKVEENAEPFYGYYTLDIQRDGAIVGMLSVNGYTSQVFLHAWHGDFIEMSSE